MPRDNESRTVYTTEQGRVCPNCGKPIAGCACKSKAARAGVDGIVRVALEKKGRGGKTVTVITGLSGTDEELRAMAGDLKKRCGTGGTLKDGIIEIQGDHRDTLLALLKGKGLVVKRVGG